MKILKFGGSSVADAKNINKVIDIILKSQKAGESLIVVVSALGGVTDDLISMTSLAAKGNNQFKKIFDIMCKRHNDVIQDLMSVEERKRVSKQIGKKYNEFEAIIENIFFTTDTSAHSRDLVMSFGEQLSAYVIAEAIKSRGVECNFVDARNFVKTDDNFGEANVEIETSYKLISDFFIKNPVLSVVGGFIASTKEGMTTTLGRGGSDYTASILGAALDASTIEIWTDVDGLMTADPRKVKNAIIIPEISYEKAEEMANAGAKVIHPKTMRPARLKNIPIYIKNTFNPKGKGTKISNPSSRAELTTGQVKK